jgi:putative tributyrin esterase
MNMALLQVDFRSEILEADVSMNVILPNNRTENTQTKVVYLLHGYSGNHTNWIRLTAIERYIRDQQIAIIMPNMGNSFYTDMAYGFPYFTFLTDELPKKISSFFNLKPNQKDTYIAGLSMGGYGALKAALTYPKRYHKAVSLSGALDAAKLYETAKEKKPRLYYETIFGIDNIKNTKHDLFHLITTLKNQNESIPDIFIACGLEDFLYEDNIKFVKHLQSNQVKHTYLESKGAHTWDFWDQYIEKALDWMLNDDPKL